MTQYIKPFCRVVAIAICLIFWGTLAALLSSCAGDPVAKNILAGTRPVVTDTPVVAPVTASITEARRASGVSMKAIRRAQRSAVIADAEAVESAGVILDYKKLVEELRLTDDLMATRFAALTRDYEALDVRRLATIAALKGDLVSAEAGADLALATMEAAQARAGKLSAAVAASQVELRQYRQERPALEREIVEGGKRLAKAESRADKFERKYLKLTKYRWVVAGLGAWLLIKLVVAASNFTPQGRLARMLMG